MDGIRPRYVLGVNTGPHDASAALLRDGELVAMVEQERLSRNRHAFGESPRDAIAACLAEADIGLEAVAELAVGWDVPMLVEIEGGSFDERRFAQWLVGTDARRAPPLRYVGHHLAHAASGFYTSGLSEAAILVIDGRGEAVATTLAVGGPAGIEIIRTWGTDQSIGHLYGWASEWAGLTMWGTGKLMGLASYGRAGQPVPLAPSNDGYAIADAPPPGGSHPHHFVQLRSRLRNGFRRHNFPYCEGDLLEPMAHADFAASVQQALEEVILSLATLARRETGYSALVLGGGVALNCTANGRLIRSGTFDEVWIPPFPHDAGVSLGAALVADRALSGSRAVARRLPHARWGPATAAVDDALLARLARCEVVRLGDSQLAEAVAQHLEEGRLVGWWQGRAEVGQRALGARSILCDPRRRDALVRTNLVKGREIWRPLAPAVLADRAGELFASPLPAAADFMLAALPVREEARARLPAAVHVDGSARPQAVEPTQSRYRAVIEAFCERTGVPAVVNTSFNLAGEPMVLSASDAVGTFLRSELDVLVLDDLVALRPASPRATDARVPRVTPPKLSFIPWEG
jgi:carbamoyltransferase